MNIESQIDYALSLIDTSAYPHEIREGIKDFIINETDQSILNAAITKLKDNQLNVITHRGEMRKISDITKHINKITRT